MPRPIVSRIIRYRTKELESWHDLMSYGDGYDIMESLMYYRGRYPSHIFKIVYIHRFPHETKEIEMDI